MDCVNRGILTLVGLFPLLLLAAPAEARLNLLQSKQVMTLPANLVGSIRASLEPSPTGPVAFAAPIQADLLRALPQDFRAACPSLIESWGDIARGTDEWRVRVLDEAANSVRGVRLSESWSVYSLESHDHTEDLSTDADGYVTFPRRTVKANLLVRIARKAFIAIVPHQGEGHPPLTYSS